MMMQAFGRRHQRLSLLSRSSKLLSRPSEVLAAAAVGGSSRRFMATLRELTGRSNIVLMGSPGSGKTSVGRTLGGLLNMPVYDIDDDHLEAEWGCSVSSKVDELGDSFLQAEGEACQKLDKQDTIISLSGSVPLHDAAMKHMAKSGVVVYLDVQPADILKRMEKMDVGRIIGHKESSLADILAARRDKYEGCYDMRVLVPEGATVDEIAALVKTEVEKDQDFVSTRDATGGHTLTFFETVRQGLAPDRGLYFPKHIPSFTLAQLERMVDMNYYDRALRILESFPTGTLHPSTLRDMLTKAYSSFEDPWCPVPITHLKDKTYLMEEYHGPTASFKDLALQLTPQLFSAACEHAGKGGEDHCFLVATSGDTGSACLDGFGKNPNTPVVVLYPKDGVSAVQRAHMCSIGGDTFVLGVDGDFDFCQDVVKDMFQDNELNERLLRDHNVHLASGNSINWGRLFPQVPYTFHAYLDLVRQGYLEMGQPMDLCVPTGNFGNILGGVLAKKMGLPVRKLVVACNENNILADFTRTGVFDRDGRTLLKTPAPSIDILLPSNLERYLYLLCDGDAKQTAAWFDDLNASGQFQLSPELLAKMQNEIVSDWSSTEDCLATIKDTFKGTNALVDPHTAVAVHVCEQRKTELSDDGTPTVIASTAHYSKFPSAMLQALGLQHTEDDSVEKVLGQLMEVGATSDTAFHSKMAEVPNKQAVHTDTCAGDPAVVRARIEEFLTSRRAKKA